MKTAIILGATGLVGGHLLKRLLSDNRYTKLIVFGRRSCGVQHDKLEEHLVNLFELETYTNKFKADVVFCCIGTTKAKTANTDMYTKIDYGIPVTAAKLCKHQAISCFIVISALGANTNSTVFYNRVKGEMERDVLAQNITKTYVL